jgi:hypothetical protein
MDDVGTYGAGEMKYRKVGEHLYCQEAKGVAAEGYTDRDYRRVLLEEPFIALPGGWKLVWRTLAVPGTSLHVIYKFTAVPPTEFVETGVAPRDAPQPVFVEEIPPTTDLRLTMDDLGEMATLYTKISKYETVSMNHETFGEVQVPVHAIEIAAQRSIAKEKVTQQLANAVNRITSFYYNNETKRCSLNLQQVNFAAHVGHSCLMNAENFLRHLAYSEKRRSCFAQVLHALRLKSTFESLVYYSRRMVGVTEKEATYKRVKDQGPESTRRYNAMLSQAPITYKPSFPTWILILLALLYFVYPAFAADQVVDAGLVTNELPYILVTLLFIIVCLFVCTKQKRPKRKVSLSYSAYREEYSHEFKIEPNGSTYCTISDGPEQWAGYEIPEQLIKIPRLGAEFGTIKAAIVADKDPLQMLYHYGVGFCSNIPMVAARTPRNMRASIINRQLRPVSVPDLSVVSSLRRYAQYSLGASGMRVKPIVLSFEKWNARFPEQRRAAHIRALEKISTPEELMKSELRFDTFMKIELISKRGEDFDPRNINGCTPEYNVILGPFIYAINNEVKECWNVDNPVYYTSGATVNQLGSWFEKWSDKFGSPTYVENDFSRFDSTISPEMLEIEFDLYELYHPSRTQRQCLQAQIDCYGQTREGFYFKVKGTRKSGTPNTSLGNTYLNVMVHLYAMETIGYRPGFDFALMSVGDDMLMILGPHAEVGLVSRTITAVCRSVGFEPKVKTNTRKCEVEYCSKVFWPSDKGTIAGVKIGRFLTRHGWSTKPLLPGETPAARMLAVAQTMQTLSSHIPVVNEICDIYKANNFGSLAGMAGIRLRQRQATLLEIHDRIDTSIGVPAATDETYEFFTERYGVSAVEFIKQLLKAMKFCRRMATHLGDTQAFLLVPPRTLLDLDISMFDRDMA